MATTVLPPMEHTFTINVIGQKTKQVFDGTFTFTIPTLRTESMIEKTKVRLNEGLAVSEDTDFIHDMVAHLIHTLTDTPEWWKTKGALMDIRDLNVYTELYQTVKKFESDWRAKVWADDEQPK